MKIEDRILEFEPNVHTALWGHEEWLVSRHPSAMGIVKGGKFAGMKLEELAPGFNLLVKIIDAKTRLSVQVHPNETTRLVTGGDPKTEMWCALAGGEVYAGLKAGVGPADIENAVKDGSFEKLMVRHTLKKGDAIFIPGGLVHAISDNTLVYEVQQSSDTTFRLYDWGRVGADGKPRQLHVAQALKAIDYNLAEPRIVRDVKCAFFDFHQIDVAGGYTVSGKGWSLVYVLEGEIKIGGKSFAQGSSMLVLEGDDFVVSSTGAKILLTK